MTGDPALAALHEELAAYPGGGQRPRRDSRPARSPSRCASAPATRAVLPQHRTTFGTAVDVTVAELAIESFFPADEETARFVRAWSERATPPPGTMTA